MNINFPFLRTTSRLMLIVTFILGVVGCVSSGSSGSSSGGSNEKLMIRVRNNSTLDIDNFWLGAGPRGGSTGNTAYGGIKQGEASRYRGVEPQLDNYRKMNFVAAGQRYLGNIDPQEHIGQAELPFGWYTFAYTIENGEPVLTLIEDPAQ